MGLFSNLSKLRQYLPRRESPEILDPQLSRPAPVRPFTEPLPRSAAPAPLEARSRYEGPLPVADREIVLELGDVFDRIPAHFVKPGHHNRKRVLTFKVSDLFSQIARGRACIPLSSIAIRCPEVFRSQVSLLEDMDIQLPLQKVVEQICPFPHPHASSMAEEEATEDTENTKEPASSVWEASAAEATPGSTSPTEHVPEPPIVEDTLEAEPSGGSAPEDDWTDFAPSPDIEEIQETAAAPEAPTPSLEAAPAPAAEVERMEPVDRVDAPRKESLSSWRVIPEHAVVEPAEEPLQPEAPDPLEEPGPEPLPQEDIPEPPVLPEPPEDVFQPVVVMHEEALTPPPHPAPMHVAPPHVATAPEVVAPPLIVFAAPEEGSKGAETPHHLAPPQMDPVGAPPLSEEPAREEATVSVEDLQEPEEPATPETPTPMPPEPPPAAQPPPNDAAPATPAVVPAPDDEPLTAPPLLQPIPTVASGPRILSGSSAPPSEAPESPAAATVAPPLHLFSVRPPSVHLAARAMEAPRLAPEPSAPAQPPPASAPALPAAPFDETRFQRIFGSPEPFDPMAVAASIRRLEGVRGCVLLFRGEEFEGGDIPEDLTVEKVRGLARMLTGTNGHRELDQVRSMTLRGEQTSITVWARSDACVCVSHEAANLPDNLQRKMESVVEALLEPA